MWSDGLFSPTDWLAGWPRAFLPWMKPLPAHSTGTVLAYEWYCIVRTLSIPALLNGFDHWFRFSYTVLVESVSLPPFWTPWFFWLTCLEAAMEMSCCPSHGLDPTFTLIDNKKNLEMGPIMHLFSPPSIVNYPLFTRVLWWSTLLFCSYSFLQTSKAIFEKTNRTYPMSCTKKQE